MKIIAVVGTGSGCGKTTVACRILRAIPGLAAVKISPRDGPGRLEWGAGEPGKDTALYVDSGAVRVARIVGPRAEVGAAWELIKGDFNDCKGVVIEGAGALDLPGSRFAVFVRGESEESARIDRNRAIEAKCDCIIDRSSHFVDQEMVDAVRFYLSKPDN